MEKADLTADCSMHSLSQVHSLTLNVAMQLASLYTTKGSDYTQMKAQCIRYTATDFHADRFGSVFKNQLQSWSTDFGFLPPSLPLSETAEASGIILQLRHTCVFHSVMTQ